MSGKDNDFVAGPPIDLDEATKPIGSDGSYTIDLSDRWQLWGPSGGYLSAIALRAAGDLSALPRPLSFYCHFLKSPRFAAVEVLATPLRSGKRSESIEVSILQDGDLVFKAFVRTAGESSGHDHQVVQIPAAEPPVEINEFKYRGPMWENYTYWDHFERRPVTTVSGSTSRDPRLLEWVRCRPNASFADPYLDAARSLMTLDTFGYLAVRQKYTDGMLFAPNLDTSAWFHDIPAQTDWLLLEHKSPVARDGVIFVEGNLWSEDGKLVASGSAQLLQLERG